VFLLRFLLLDSLANGLLIYFIMKIRLPLPAENTTKLIRRPALAAALLIAALTAEVLL
jgi:hypothetical protein